jgi:hypothetical protein
MERLANPHPEVTAALPQHGVVVTSVPKSGTHLLQNLLTALPGLRPGPNLMVGIEPTVDHAQRVPLYVTNLSQSSASDVSITHFHYSSACVKALDALPHRRVFLLRDPKDFIVSYIDYVLDDGSGHFHRPLLAEQPDDAARIKLLITGHPGRARLLRFVLGMAG